MKYIKILLASTLTASFIYFLTVIQLIDAPIQAGYWINEMIVVKKNLVKHYAGTRKIIIAGGSSTLFGIDAEKASEQLHMPVINFGLTAELRLSNILRLVDDVIEYNDILIFPLEPPYFDCRKKFNSGQIENIIGWDHETWSNLRYTEKIEIIALISPKTLKNMIVASYQRKFLPSQVADRVNSLDSSFVLSKFYKRAPPLDFQYSAYHLDNYGDMLKTDAVMYNGAGWDESKPNHICSDVATELSEFVRKMKIKGVSVYFANTPYMSSETAKESVRESELSFKKEFSSIGCFIDKREELIFDSEYFFNSHLHLNENGKAIRTDLLINSLRNNVLLNNCVKL